MRNIKIVRLNYMPATSKVRAAAKKNIKKAQAKGKSLSKSTHKKAQPKGPDRQRPGAGGGRFYRIEIRPKTEFATFRTQDLGGPGHLERIGGKRKDGSWDTVTWLIAKGDAHVSGSNLIIDNPRVKSVLKQIAPPIVHQKGDVFTAKAKKDMPKRNRASSSRKKTKL